MMKAEELFVQAPVGIGIYNGPSFVVTLVNDIMLEYWSRKREEVINKPLFDALPEGRGQGFEEVMNEVFSKGKKFITDEVPVTLNKGGKLETIFTKLIFTPLHDS